MAFLSGLQAHAKGHPQLEKSDTLLGKRKESESPAAETDDGKSAAGNWLSIAEVGIATLPNG
ncbi:MAG: hypothetical protein RIS22_674 [Actinomycetota bacterium]